MTESGKIKVEEVRSGGQTGVDRAALDAAIELGIPTGGFVPLGRQAEDGLIPARYKGLIETASADPADRTAKNVEAADGTLLISASPPTGGSAFTLDCARRLGKPIIQVDLSRTEIPEAVVEIERWLEESDIRVLNVAGPRASEDPNAYQPAKELLIKALSGQ